MKKLVWCPRLHPDYRLKGLKEYVERSRMELVEPVVEARFAATDDELERCRELGRNVARAVRGKYPA
jgi:hypothetical protein